MAFDEGYEAMALSQEPLKHKHAIAQANIHAEGDNPFCGDSIKFSGVVDDTGLIRELGFEGYSCSICETACEKLVDYSLGKHTDQVHSLKQETVDGFIKCDIPSSRKHCASLPLETLKSALK